MWQAPVPRPHISAVINAIRCSLAKDSEKAMGHSWSRGFDDHEGADLSPTSLGVYRYAAIHVFVLFFAIIILRRSSQSTYGH